MYKTLLIPFLMLSIFSCFRSSGPPKNIEDWLDKTFPGQFQVLNSNLRMLDVMAQFKGDKQALIADKADPEVQFLLDWNKKTEGLGISPAMIEQARAQAKTNVAEARALYPLLKAAGLEKVAVGVAGEDVFIQVFEEPSPEQRANILASVRAAMKKGAKSPEQIIHLSIMEPAAFQARFKEIIPKGHFLTENAWQNEEEILQAYLELAQIDHDPVKWEVNSVSRRCSGIHDEAFEVAKTWADKHLKKPFVFAEDQLVGVETLSPSKKDGRDQGPAIRFSFPYYIQKPIEPTDPEGYVTGIFYFDKRTFEQLKTEKVF